MALNASLIFAVVGVALGIAGPVIGYLLYLAGKREKLFGQRVKVHSLFQKGDEIKDFSIRFEGHEVTSLSFVTVTCWNPGTETILGEEISAVDPLRVELPSGAQIFSIHLTRQTHDHVSATLTFQRNIVRIRFDQLEGQDGLMFRILASSPTKISEGGVLGSIRGIKDIRRIPETLITSMERFMGSLRFISLVPCVIILVFAFALFIYALVDAVLTGTLSEFFFAVPPPGPPSVFQIPFVIGIAVAAALASVFYWAHALIYEVREKRMNPPAALRD